MEHSTIMANFGIKDWVIHAFSTSLNNVESLLPIQFDIVNNLLKQNNFLIQAKAGTGKTTGYIVGAINTIDISLERPQVLVICPDQGHYNQISGMITDFIKNIPGLKFNSIEKHHLQDNFDDLITSHIILTYPGKLLYLLEKDIKLFEHVNKVIVDETQDMIRNFADIFEKIVEILNQTPTLKNWGFITPYIEEESVNLISKVITDLYVIKYS